MQNRFILIVTGILLILSVGLFVYLTKKPIVLPAEQNAIDTQVTDKNLQPLPNQTKPVTKIPPTGITLSAISKHGTRASCWSAINGKVYDLTSWIPNHPGGEETILSLCGKDGSDAYNGQHEGASRPALTLAGFKIGTLAK